MIPRVGIDRLKASAAGRRPKGNLLRATFNKQLLPSVGLCLTAALAIQPALAGELATNQSAPALAEAIWGAWQAGPRCADLRILHPLDGALFPPEMAPPEFRWADAANGADAWLVVFQFGEDPTVMRFLVRSTAWTPSRTDWETTKERSRKTTARLTILGVRYSAPASILSAGAVSFSISPDEVGAPIFFREVELPLTEAGKDPSRLRWRLAPVSASRPPPPVLEGLPLCANCHSFPQDGRTLAMDIDFPGKGGYLMAPIHKQMVLTRDQFIDWDDYQRKSKEPTTGLFSQISPGGRFVVSTVKDKSVFLPRAELEMSQLFFPIKGILAVYDREQRTLRALPGADDPAYVQTNPAWSPDGKDLVFARSRAYPLERFTNQFQMQWTFSKEFDRERKAFRFDLYRIPFNDGRGGQAEPLAGASHNGLSNFFPKYSPDGKWIVFCRAQSYMMLQPDSELYLVPAAGGSARRLLANTSRMNSWHSWSPNSKWLVFASKANSAYTQLFLTHIDERGNSSPPVCLARLSDPQYAANLPEFLNGPANAIEKIQEQFAHDRALVRAGNHFYKSGEIEAAMEAYRQALELNPANSEAHQRLGLLLFHVKASPKPGLNHLVKALATGPQNPYFHHDLGIAQLHQGQLDAAVAHLKEAVRLILDVRNEYSTYDPLDDQYKLGLALLPRHRRFRLVYPVPEMQLHTGLALLLQGNLKESADYLYCSIFVFGCRNDPNFLFLAAVAQAHLGSLEKARAYYTAAWQLKPELAASISLADFLGPQCALAETFRAAVAFAEKAIRSGDPPWAPATLRPGEPRKPVSVTRD